jgi:F-type H+-transporting ATPase subunit alpha
MTEILKQGQYKPLAMEEQVVSIYSASPKPPRASWLRRYDLSDIRRYEEEMLGFMRTKGSEVLRAIRESGQLAEDTEAKLSGLLDEFANHFQPSKALDAA